MIALISIRQRYLLIDVLILTYLTMNSCITINAIARIRGNTVYTTSTIKAMIWSAVIDI